MPIIEIGCMGVKSGLNIMDDTTQEGLVLMEAWKAVTAVPDGPHQVSWGLEIENPLTLWAFFDWDSVEDHEKFAKSSGGEAVKELPTILTHGEFTKHIDVTPSPPLQSPVTEVMLAYFPSDISSTEKDRAAARLEQFVEKSHHKFSNFKTVSYGWGVENDFPVRGGEKGQMGSVLTVFIGWSSIDANVKFRETVAFKDGLNLIRAMEGISKLVVFHISCRILENRAD